MKRCDLEKLRRDIEDLRNENVELQKRQIEKSVQVRFPSFDENNDSFDSYVKRFENVANFLKWPKHVWAMQFSLLLTGPSLDTFCSLSPEQQQNYNVIKETLMRKYALTEQEYRKGFFGTKVKEKEMPILFMARLERLFDGWIETSKTQRTFDRLKNLLLREEFYNRCHPHLKAYLREKQNNTTSTVVTSTQRYLDAYGGTIAVMMTESLDKICEDYRNEIDRNHSESGRTTRRKNENSKTKTSKANGSKTAKGETDGDKTQTGVKRCFRCGSFEHLIKDCLKKLVAPVRSQGVNAMNQCIICSKPGHSEEACWYRDRREGDRVCFRCGSKNHLVKNCDKPRQKRNIMPDKVSGIT